MKKIIYIFLIYNFNFLFVTAQPLFQRTIGGTNHDYANSIIQTTDGGYAMAGYTFSYAAGFEDMYIVKLNNSGALQWTRTIGGTSDDRAQSIIQTTDGGYAVAGYSRSFGTGADLFIVKLDAGGTLQWSRTVDQTPYDYAGSIIQTTDGGFVITGQMSTGGVFTTDIPIVKFNSAGSLLWSKTYGGSHDDIAYSIIQTTDGGLAAAGYANSFGSGGNDFYIIKTDSIGTLQWSRTIWGTNYGSDAAFSLIQTTDGGFVLAGETESSGAGSHDMYIVKLGAGGSLVWARTMGGVSEDRARSIVQTVDGGFVVTGYTLSFGVSDFYTVKLNGSGTLQWSKTFGGSGIENAYSIIKTAGGGFAVAGQTMSFGAGANDIFIVKIDSLGNTCGSFSSPSTISGTDGTLGSPTSTVITINPIVTTPAPVSGTGGILTTICIVGIQPISNEIPASYELFQNYPNPFNPSTAIKFDIPKSSHVQIVVYDILGREVDELLNEEKKPGSYEITWDGSGFSSSIYFYRIVTDEFVETKKMVLIK